MKVSTFGKIAVSAGAVALVAGVLATPAYADPATGSFGTLVGLGSDTTQDVVNGLASTIGGNKLASYDAISSVGNTVITRSGGVAIPRASGSGAGRDELRVAIGQIATATVAVSSGPTQTVNSSVIGQIDFARSSGGPGATDVSSEGVLTYVPFARDAVDVAVDPTSPLANVPWFLGNGTEASTAPSLYNVYRANITYVYKNSDGSYNSAGTAATGPTGTTAAKLQPILPKSGSGTRSYFIGQLGFSGADADASNWVTAHATFGVKDTFGASSTPIEEHDGTAIAIASAGLPSGTFAIGPFSIGQYVAQNNAVNGLADRRHGVILPSLGKLAADTRQPATTGSGTAISTNTAYAAMVRDVYNIVPSRLADDPTSNIAKMFVGSTSLVCSNPSVITTYGFLTSPICGTTPSSLRAYAASTSTTTLSVPSSTTVGSPVTATATIASNGNGGGTVRFMSGSTLVSSVAIAQGATTASATVPASSAGSVALKAIFVPTLAGVASSTTPDATITVNAVATTPVVTTPVVTTPVVTTPVPIITVTSKATPKITVSKIKAVKVGKTAKVTIKVTGTSTVTGTVTVKEGKKVLVKSAKLKKGKVTVSIKKVKKGTHKLTVTYNGNGKFIVKSKTGLLLKAK